MPAIVALLALLFIRLPTGFLPDEDQGFIINLITLPAGATQHRTMKVAQQVAKYFNETEKKQCRLHLHRGGLQLRRRRPEYRHRLHPSEDWDERKGFDNSAQSPSPSAPSAHFMPMPRRPGLSASCRLRCRNWATPPASTCSWKTAAISAMPALIAAPQPAAGPGGAGSPAGLCAAQQPGRHPAAAYRYRPGQGQRAGRVADRHQLHPQRRLGLDLHQRFHRSRPRQARLYAGRRALTA